MEIRARYVLVGLFVLSVVLAGAGFVYWLWGVNGLTDRANYAVRFTGPVNGVSAGSEVAFNGINVGEVTGLSLDPQKPGDVIVTIAVDRATPVRADTRAGIAFSGLTGAGKIALFGGADDAPPLPSGNPAMIRADNEQTRDLTDAARGTLGEINRIITDNATSVQSAIASIDTFAGALARNAEKVDSIIAGLERMTGGGSTPDYALRDLPAPMGVPAADVPDGQLVVARPTSVVALATQRILIAGANGDVPVFDEVRWADSLPILIQARTVEAFENAGYVKVVSDAGLASGEFQLALDLRAFHIVPGAMAAAEVTLAAKLLDSAGKVIDAKTFSETVPLMRTDESAAAVAGLSAAFGTAVSDLTGWALAAMTLAEAAAPPAPLLPAPDPLPPLAPAPNP
jgi:phospholipid/cholesterol/gamma-HCH transport system substrate-binding protein